MKRVLFVLAPAEESLRLPKGGFQNTRYGLGIPYLAAMLDNQKDSNGEPLYETCAYTPFYADGCEFYNGYFRQLCHRYINLFPTKYSVCSGRSFLIVSSKQRNPRKYGLV